MTGGAGSERTRAKLVQIAECENCDDRHTSVTWSGFRPYIRGALEPVVADLDALASRLAKIEEKLEQGGPRETVSRHADPVAEAAIRLADSASQPYRLGGENRFACGVCDFTVESCAKRGWCLGGKYRQAREGRGR